MRLFLLCTSIIFMMSGLFELQILHAQELELLQNTKSLDSMRNKFDGHQDSIIPSAKFIRYTTLKMLKDSVRTLPLDTTLVNFQYPSVLFQPMNPTLGNGNLGLAAKTLLFQPFPIIGFDFGMHSLDIYRLTHEDILYYRARSPLTSLYYSNAGVKEQILKITHSQNIKKNWNIGANFNRIGAEGFYDRQRGDVLNASLQSWYFSPNKRYNMMASAVFNTLKTYENGGLEGNNPFEKRAINEPTALPVNYTRSGNQWRDNGVMFKNNYFIGRIDSFVRDSIITLYPTNKVTHTFTYANQSFLFYKNDPSIHTNILPIGKVDTLYTKDTTNIKHFKNELTYTFFLRGKNTETVKNEVKIDAGIVYDLYFFKSFTLDSLKKPAFGKKRTFQNVSVMGDLSYRLSNRLNLNFYAQQLVQGLQAGDFYYQGTAFLNLGKIAGKIAMQASIQNKSPQLFLSETQSNHYQWSNQFNRTKTTKTSFSYDNDLLKFSGSVNYYLIANYLYLQGSVDSTALITPMQYTPLINLLQVSLKKTFAYKKFAFTSYWVYQKTDNPNLIRTPELYTFNSISFKQTAFKYFKFEMGIDGIYNTSFKNFGYSMALGQFYNSDKQSNLASYPIINMWIKANLKRANFFARYDYLNQGIFSPGYYTVENYPMGNRILKLGFIWNFYD